MCKKLINDFLFLALHFHKNNISGKFDLFSTRDVISLFIHGFNCNIYSFLVILVTPIQDGVGQKGLSTSFFHVASTNVENYPKYFLIFSFNLFATLVCNFKAIPSASPKLLNLKQDHPSKRVAFLVKSL